jgi:C4-dicarboxylate transporter DctQ subunit
MSRDCLRGGGLSKLSRFLWILKAFEWFVKQLGWIAGSLTIVMMIAVMREVVGRYFFHLPSDWSLELSGYLLVALAYLGASYTEIIEGHIRIDFLYERFKGKIKIVMDIVIPCIGLCWSSMLVWQGSRLAFHSLKIGARSADAMMWPLFPSQIIIPVGAALLSLVLIGKVIINIAHLVKGIK